MTHRSAIQVENLRVSYFTDIAVRDVSFTVPTGTMTAIVGPNGAGKSTLLKALLRLVPIDTGEVLLLGQNVKRARRRVAYVPQRGEVDWTFPITVADTVLLGTYPRLGLFRRPGRAERRLAHEMLEKVGMAPHANTQVGQLSGGQQQRVFLARALAQQAEVVLLDEPFIGLDRTSERVVVDILQGLRDRGTTIVGVHHDLGTVSTYFERVLLLNREVIAHGPAQEVLSADLLSRTYQSVLPPLVPAHRAGSKEPASPHLEDLTDSTTWNRA